MEIPKQHLVGVINSVECKNGTVFVGSHNYGVEPF